MDKNLKGYTKRRIRNNFFGDLLRKSITNWIILANVIVFVIVFFMIQYLGLEKTLSLVALQTNGFLSGKIWTVLTSMFVHFELWHLLANMVSLYFLGNFVEKLIGKKRMIWFYIISGIFAGLFYVFLSYCFGTSPLGMRLVGSPETYAVGASGAIFALLGLLALLTPKYPVYLIAGPIVAIIIQAILPNLISAQGILSIADIVISAYVLIAIFSMLSQSRSLIKIGLPVKMKLWVLPIVAIVPLIVIGLFVELPIGNTAHLGGLIAGLIYAGYLRNKYKKKTSLMVEYFSE